MAYFSIITPTKQCQGPKTPDCIQCRELVKDRYDLIINYNFKAGKSKGGFILPFTQVVWRQTTDLGMATSMSKDNFFAVARYKHPGNVGFSGDYKKNVPKPI